MKNLLKKFKWSHRYKLYSVSYDMYRGNTNIGSGYTLVKAKSTQEAVEITREHSGVLHLEIMWAEELSYHNNGSHWVSTSYKWNKEERQKQPHE